MPMRPASVRPPRKPAVIESHRKRLFDELLQLRELQGTSARSIDTARALLTNWWAKANWRTREELIKSADWVVRLESTRAIRLPPTLRGRLAAG